MKENLVSTSADHPGVVAMPPLLFAGALVLVLALRWLRPMPISGGAVALWSGLVLVVLGLGLAVWGRRTLMAAGTNVNPRLPTTTIVTAGPFRFSRNPLYLAMTLLFLGLTVTLDTWWGLVVLIPLLILIHWGVVRREERYLEKKFGESYRQYQAQVRRYL